MVVVFGEVCKHDVVLHRVSGVSYSHQDLVTFLAVSCIRFGTAHQVSLAGGHLDEGGKMLCGIAFDVEGINFGRTNMGLAPESADLTIRSCTMRDLGSAEDCGSATGRPDPQPRTQSGTQLTGPGCAAGTLGAHCRRRSRARPSGSPSHEWPPPPSRREISPRRAH